MADSALEQAFAFKAMGRLPDGPRGITTYSGQSLDIQTQISLGTNDPDRALRIYDATLVTLSIVRLEMLDGIAAGSGREQRDGAITF